MTSGQYVPTHAIERPDLLRQLDEGLKRPVTLVVAQAGSGKSVLLTQWLRTLTIDTRWLDITAADDDPEYFSRHLLSTIAGDRKEQDESSDTVALAGPVLGPQLVADVEAMLADAGPCVIVLDDLHNLHSAAILEDLRTVLTRLPPSVHVVLSSRTDPPIAWGHRRVRGEVGELRQAELALSKADSGRLLQAVSGVELSDQSVSALVARTEGWAAGLQLAAMTLRHHPEPETFIAQFSGSDRLVADFLSEEVVQSLSMELRNLLFNMAALDRMCDDLVADVSDAPGARSALGELERASMFLIPLQDDRQWFRFHQLFRDLLRLQAHNQDPLAERVVLRKAARWHLSRNEWQPAIEYLIRAEDWDEAIDLVLVRGSDVFERGEIAQVIGVIEQIPQPLREASIDLCLLHGILIGITGRHEASEDILRRVAAMPTATTGQRTCAQTFLASLAQWRPQPQITIGWAREALAALERDSTQQLPDILRLTDMQSLRTIATVSGGRAHFLAGDIAEARRWLEQALLTQGAAYSLWRISALGSLALLEAWIGRNEQAESLASDAFVVAEAVSALHHPSTAEAHLAHGLAALARGAREEAAQSIDEGWVRAEANGRAQLEWVFWAVSRPLASLLSPHAKPASHPPPVAEQRLELAARSGVHPNGWVAARRDSTLGHFEGSEDDAPVELSDPLTERELQILAYLPTRITSGELAAHLYLSVNTVKSHLAHIYRKLEVANRTDAVMRATELGLLR